MTKFLLGKERARSFVFKDSLYVCGGSAKNIFTLNFGKKANLIDHLILNLKDTMEWKRFQQQEDYFWRTLGLSGDIYKDHLVIFRHEISGNENFQLHCWNISIQYFLPYFS